VGRKKEVPKQKLRSGLRKEKKIAQRQKFFFYQCTIHPGWCTGGCWFTVALYEMG
jgi:hypothetical protein